MNFEYSHLNLKLACMAYWRYRRQFDLVVDEVEYSFYVNSIGGRTDVLALRFGGDGGLIEVVETEVKFSRQDLRSELRGQKRQRHLEKLALPDRYFIAVPALQDMREAALDVLEDLNPDYGLLTVSRRSKHSPVWWDVRVARPAKPLSPDRDKTAFIFFGPAMRRASALLLRMIEHGMLKR